MKKPADHGKTGARSKGPARKAAKGSGDTLGDDALSKVSGGAKRPLQQAVGHAKGRPVA